MPETFNPIISHLYSGQGGVSREITKYNNATISEINAVNNGVTTKYDFGGKYVEKMYSGDRVWNQYADCTNPSSLSQAGNVISSKLFTFNTNHKYLFVFDGSFQTAYTGCRFSAGIWNNAMTSFKRHIINADSLSKRYAFVTDGISALDDGSGTLSDFSSVKVAIQCIDPSSVLSASNKVTISNVQCIDITLVYGVGNEPSTVAGFVHDYPEVYYPYNAGTDFSLATKLFSTIKQPIDSIKFYGNTIKWNQHARELTSTYWYFAGGTGTISDGVATFTASTQYGALRMESAYRHIPVATGHKFLLFADVKLSSATDKVKLALNWNEGAGEASISVSSSTSWQRVAGIVTNSGTSYNDGFLQVFDARTADWDAVQVKNICCFNLTAIYGAGNEPTTVSDFTRRLKKLYYPFTNGEILSIEKASEYLYGINIWDEEWEVGQYNITNGEKVASLVKIRSKNLIRVSPNTNYYFVVPNTIAVGNVNVCYYDGGNNFISFTSGSTNPKTTPANASYMAFYLDADYGTTYNNDICINLSDSSINGTYEASKGEQKMQLDSFNVWDEEWEVGKINWDGANMGSSDNIRSKNYIHIVGGSEYYVKIPTSRVEVFYYDYNKSFISYEISSLANQIFTPPASACYMRFYTQQAYGTTYNNDICINLSDPSRNGIYVPYRKYVELNGINDVIDTVTVEKNVTLPFGLVDLGTLNWLYDSSLDIFHFDQFDGKTNGAQMICSNYEATLTLYPSSATLPDKSIGNKNYYTTTNIFVKDSAYTDATTFKAAMKGIYLYYELADHPLNDTPILAGSYVRKIGEYTFNGTETWEQGGSQTAAGMYRYYTRAITDMKFGLAQGGWCNKFDNLGSNWDSSTTDGVFFGYNNELFQFVTTTAKTNAELQAIFNSTVTIYYLLETPVETTLTAQQCAEILNGAFTKSKYSTLLIDNDNGQIDQTVDVSMWEQR